MAVGKRRAEDEAPEVRNNVIEAPIVPRRVTVSESLRGRRIECGLDVDYVAEILRIRAPVLVAIENGDFDQLPGPAYAVGFVRSYATYLGLDADALVVRFKSETAEIAKRPHLQFPLPIRDSRVPTGPLLVICVLLAIAVYGGWYYYFARPGQLAEIVPSVPARLQHLLEMPPPQKEAPKPAAETIPAPAISADAAASAPQPPQAGAPQPIAPTSGPAVSQTAATPPAPQPQQAAVDGVPPVENTPGAPPIVAALPASPDLAQPAVNGDAAKSPGDTSYGAPEGTARVVLHATADSWIQVRDKGSNLLFTRVLKPGEHYNVPNQDGLTMIVGNAGALDVTVDGMAAPHVGELGKVARNVILDPAHLLATASHAN